MADTELNSQGVKKTSISNFIELLHDNPSAYFTPPKDIDWTEAPSFYPQPFEATVLSFQNLRKLRNSGIDKIGEWLWMSVGCHRTRIIGAEVSDDMLRFKPKIMTRRTLPSGGASYPTEVYIEFGRQWDNIISGISQYVWVYLPQHHAIAVHSHNENQAYTGELLGLGVRLSLISVLSRTAFKYGEFAYRLTAVDCGVALGRIMDVGQQFTENISLNINDLKNKIDIITPEEIVCAQINCNFKPSRNTVETFDLNKNIINYRVSTPDHIRRAALSSGQPEIFDELFRQLQVQNAKSKPASLDNWFLMKPLYSLPIDIADIRPIDHKLKIFHERRSEAKRFSGHACSRKLFEDCIIHAKNVWVDFMSSIPKDTVLPIKLLFSTLNVNGLNEVAGTFNLETNSLDVFNDFQVVNQLNDAMLIKTFDIGMSAFAIHIAADINWRASAIGLQSYRNTQLLIGLLIDAFTTKATELKLSAHTFLGFVAPKLNELYRIDRNNNKFVCAQVCIGYAKNGPEMEVAIVT